jgi:hypothetical protein
MAPRRWTLKTLYVFTYVTMSNNIIVKKVHVDFRMHLEFRNTNIQKKRSLGMEDR